MKKCVLHKWKIDRDTGFTIYRRCIECNKRKINQGVGGYQPKDLSYLKG